MSAAREILAELRSLQFEVRATGDRLRLNGPVHALTAELKARAIAHKPELLKLLTEPLLDTGLSVREVSSIRADFLKSLPLPTVLVVELPGGGHLTVATHPGCGRADLDLASWMAWCASAPGGTVAAVLARRGATLRMVVIEGVT